MINKKCQYCGRPLAGEICPAHGYVGKDIGAPVPSTLTALRLVTAPIDPVRLPDFEYFFDAADPAGAPSPVENLSAQAGFTLVVLSWTLPSEAAWRTWKIFEGTTNGFTPGTPILTTDQMVVSIPHVTGSGPWYYKVRAVNSRNEESTDVQVGPVTMAAVTAVDIGPGSVLAAALADNAVDLASAVVTGQVAAAQIAAGTITANEIAAGAIITAKLAAGAVTTNELAAGAVTAAKITAGTITGDRLTAGTITATQIAAGTITAANIAANTIVASNIGTNTIVASNIAANTILAWNINVADVQASTVTAAKINTLTLNAGAITTGTMNAARIDGGDINGVTITGVAISGGAITAGTIIGTNFKTSATYPRIEISCASGGIVQFFDLNGAITTITSLPEGLYLTGNVLFNGAIGHIGGEYLDISTNLSVYGSVNSMEDYVSQGSPDGIWINDSYTPANRWKINYNGYTGKLWVSNSSTANYVQMTAG